MRRTGDQGQVTVMIVGFFIVVGLLAVVVINASAAFLQRQELNNVADGAALAAAQAVEEDAVYRGGLTDVGDLPLNNQRARGAVANYLAGASGVRWQVASRGTKISVRVVKNLTLPLVPPGWMDDTVVSAQATALLRIH